jgi:hypothetical protein
MASSDFWRKLGDGFRALASGDSDSQYHALQATWRQTTGTRPPVLWSLSKGFPSINLQFVPLAKRGARELPYSVTRDLLSTWLDAVKEHVPGGPKIGAVITGGVRMDESSGTILQICYRSTDLCSILESQALEAEYEAPLSLSPTPPAALPESHKAETTGEQINRFRQKCRLTIEQLAEKIGVDRRTVERHIADKTVPYSRHISAYERVFSKIMKTQVVISKMS